MPESWAAIKQRWYLLIPLLILIWLLFSGRTPLFSGWWGLALTAIVILGSAIILRVSSRSCASPSGSPSACSAPGSSSWVSVWCLA